MICVGSENVPGGISSRREPTALKANMTRTPRDFRAAMLARAGTAVGFMVCPAPCRARKAMRVPEGREEIVMGEEGNPHGCESVSEIATHRWTVVPSLGLRAFCNNGYC